MVSTSHAGIAYGIIDSNMPPTPVPGESAVCHVGGFSLWVT
jgi:hypothetical protein